MAEFNLFVQNMQAVAVGTVNGLNGYGRAMPRLDLNLNVRLMRQGQRLEIHQLRMELRVGTEVLGIGWLNQLGTIVHAGGVTVKITVPVTRDGVKLADDANRESKISVSFDLRGNGRFQKADEAEWEFVEIQTSSPHHHAVARSDWIEQVLGPLGFGKYVIMELVLPAEDQRDSWNAALQHLATAEARYWSGDDPGVLQACYAAISALDPDPQKILDKMDDPEKRNQVDALLRQAKVYMHAGRHPTKEGVMLGHFNVQRRDADFALAQTKVWLTYISRLISE